MEYQHLIDRVDDWIVNRPRAVILAFLVVSVVLSSGLAMTATDSGTDQFTEDIPAATTGPPRRRGTSGSPPAGG